MSEWQPIETAPKDGTEVILWLGHPFSRIKHARWFDGWEMWIHAEDPTPNENDDMWGTGSLVPTHWMPLPERPQ